MPLRQSNAARPAPTFTAMDLVGKLRFHYDMKVRPRINPDLRRLNALAQRPLPFEPMDARTHLRLGLQWMWDAHLAVDRQGLPTKFSIGPQYGVGVPYPETTGYTLNTFLAALPQAKELGLDLERLHALIGNCTRFLLGEQLPNGAFTGGHRNLRNYGKPSIFNTGQILLGLSAVLEHCATHTPPAAWQLDVERLRAAVHGAGDFLADQVTAAGPYDPAHSFRNKVRTYYSRATYGLMRAGQVTGNGRMLAAARRHFDWVADQQRPDGWIEHWGFDEDLAVLHTIAYTLRGLVEAGHGLGDARYFAVVRRALDRLATFDRAHFAYPDLIPSHFRADGSFLNELCITGMSQLSLAILKLPEEHRGEAHTAWAGRLIQATKHFQLRGFREPLMNGVMPASFPLRGTYQPGDLIEWGTKFFLDTMLVELGVPHRAITG